MQKNPDEMHNTSFIPDITIRKHYPFFPVEIQRGKAGFKLLKSKDDDLFYSKSNIAHLERGIKALKEGRGVEHELIEAELMM